ncbi:MAG: helix-turn-helix domain-containing protein [Kiritimatiellae bacterium]|nr:helix-turn-helix domain-containing protein [Kiritimatiellia bacterium]
MTIREQLDKAIDEIFDNPAEIKTELDRIGEERRIVDSLLAARHAAGLTQRELARASGMSAAKICRMESGTDAALRLGDVQAYLKGAGASLRFSVRPSRIHPRLRPHTGPHRKGLAMA